MLERGVLVGGKYRLERLVGAGGMASVWAAVHETLRRPVAVKCIHAEAALAPDQVERFLREARAAAAVRHRFIVDLFDFGTTDEGLPFMVMELLEGQNLADRMGLHPPLAVSRFLALVDMALSGLHAAHRAGVVHRDLKPANIFLFRDADGLVCPKLVDFGISLLRGPLLADHHAKRITKRGVVLGTPGYMSPEQIRDPTNLDHRTDLYAMGVLMYEALAGRLPHEADSIEDLLIRVLTMEPQPLEAVRPELGKSLSEVVARAMARHPDDRFADARAMRLALRSSLGAALLPAGGLGPPSLRRPRWRRGLGLRSRRRPSTQRGLQPARTPFPSVVVRLPHGRDSAAGGVTRPWRRGEGSGR